MCYISIKNDKLEFSNLTGKIDIKEIFTLKDVFNFCAKSNIDHNIISEMFGFSFDGFYKEILQPFINKEDTEYLRLGYYTTFNDYDDAELEDNTIVWDFSGIGKPGIYDKNIEEYIEESERKIYRETQALDFCKINTISELDIRIDDHINYYEYKKEGKVRNEIKLYARPSPTVFNILYAIFYEIGFNGTVEYRDDIWNTVIRRLDNYEKNGASEIITFDKFKKNLNKKIEEIKEI